MEKQILDNLREIEVFEVLREIWRNNFSMNGFEAIADQIFEDLKDVENFDEIKNILEENLNNTEFKKLNRKVRKAGNLNEFTYRILEKCFKETKNYLDYGCGRMGLIRRISKEDLKNIEKIYGFEPKAQIDYLDFDQRVQLLRTKNEVRELKNIDLITINYVLHHLNSEEILEALEICKNILSEKGRIVVLEESYLDEKDQGSLEEGEGGGAAAAERTGRSFSKVKSRPPHLTTSQNQYLLQSLGYIQNTPLTNYFENLPISAKKKIIFTNDVLMNYKNLDYMPWTMEYHSIKEWGRIFENSKLQIEQIDHLGFTKAAKLKGGTTTVFVLTKNISMELLN